MRESRSPALVVFGLFVLACSGTESPRGPADGGGGASADGAAGASGQAGSAASGGTGSGDAAAAVCPTCGPGSVCVEHQTEGGPLILPDAGRCPAGRVVSGGSRPVCDLAPTYECRTLPTECSPPPGSPPVAHCICARSLCSAGDQCADVSPTLMKCTLLAP